MQEAGETTTQEPGDTTSQEVAVSNHPQGNNLQQLQDDSTDDPNMFIYHPESNENQAYEDQFDQPAHNGTSSLPLLPINMQSANNLINIVARKRPPPIAMKNHASNGIDVKRKVLYRNFHDVDGKIYLVEISRNTHKVFIILFPNFEVPDIYIFEIMTEKQAQKLLKESSNVFQELIEKFHVKYGKLQIKGFHGKPPKTRKTSPGLFSNFTGYYS